jgi:hypothetical protein
VQNAIDASDDSRQSRLIELQRKGETVARSRVVAGFARRCEVTAPVPDNSDSRRVGSMSKCSPFSDVMRRWGPSGACHSGSSTKKILT